MKITGGMRVKADRDKESPYVAMLAAQDVANRFFFIDSEINLIIIIQVGITALHVKLRATGGTKIRALELRFIK